MSSQMRSARARPAALFLTIAVALAAAAGTHAQDGGPEASPDARVAAAVAEMESASPADIFAAARELEKLGPAAVPAAKRAIETAGPRARIGLARFLLDQKERPAALGALEKAILSEEDPVAAVLAVELIQQAAKGRDDVKALKEKLKTAKETSVRIACAKALRAKAFDTDAERVLKDYLKSEDGSARAEAAFALAEIGNVAAAKAVLDELQGEPTERGRLARAILDRERLFEEARKSAGLDAAGQVKLQAKRIDELEGQLGELKKKLAAGGAGDGAGGSTGHALLDELLKNVKLYYVEDGEKTDQKGLVDAAAKGMVSSLDPFSSYMTEKETKDFRDSMRGEYAGIGAVVSMDPKDKILTIIRPIYSGPAYKAGLRSLDKITEVEGQPTHGKTVEELVLKLKGKPGTGVKIKVFRKGWAKEKEYVLTRDTINLKSVHTAVLPGGIGYLALSQFGEKAVEEVEAGLQALETEGIRGLVFDLRANPGGLLQAAVEISDKFLKDNKLIVYSKGRNEFIAPYRPYHTKDPNTHPDYPIVVLVNHASASASEIVAGALQDHKRATLIGETTFGKGSVQQLMAVKATNEESTLRLTIAKYYLPSGRSIHRDEKTGKGGVEPDVVVENENDPAWVVQEADRLMETGEVERYVDRLRAEHKDALAQLVVFDGFDASRYPGFEEFYRSLGTRLEANHVRRLVRAHARRLAQDDLADEFAHDLAEDVQLQRGAYELLKKLGDSGASYPEYAHFAARFDRAPEEPVKKPGEEIAAPRVPHAPPADEGAVR